MNQDLLNGLNFEPEALAQFQSVTEVVNNRFNRWLVSRKITNPLSSNIFGMESDIMAIDQKITQEKSNERELLDIELKGQEARVKKLQDQKDLLIKVNKIFQSRLFKRLQIETKDIDKVITKNLKVPEEISFLYEVLFSASVTYNKIWSGVCAIPGLEADLTRMVNDESFCKTLGRQAPKQAIKGREAVGFLGINGAKAVITLLSVRRRLNLKTTHFPLSNDKLWSFVVTAGNVANHLLKRAGYREPIQGFVLAGAAMLGHMAILNMFDDVFNQTKHDFMVDLRDKNAMDMYFVAPDVKAHPVVLAEVFVQNATHFSSQVIKSINWQQLPHVREALVQENQRTPMTQRSLFGQVLRQAIHFSKFIMLKESRQFSADHTRPYLYGAYLDKTTINDLLKHNVKQLDLRQFME